MFCERCYIQLDWKCDELSSFIPQKLQEVQEVLEVQPTHPDLWAIQKTENMEHNQEHKISELLLTNELLGYYIH